ncbi:2Fe-2S iron-sulfur cluster-binding protein, partial [Acinetobacter baumannii]|nr:2Fe-2S iron-sulfur cluster-binding protein [Acinetobacter baumannii]
MPRIKVLPHAQFCPEGAEFEVEQNANLCQSLLNKGIKIEHACDMSCACTTCHVIV